MLTSLFEMKKKVYQLRTTSPARARSNIDDEDHHGDAESVEESIRQALLRKHKRPPFTIEDPSEHDVVSSLGLSSTTCGSHRRHSIPSCPTKWRHSIVSVLTCLIMLLIALIGAHVILKQGTEQSKSTSIQPQDFKAWAREADLQAKMLQLITGEGYDAYSPQYQAFDWILREDPMQLSAHDADLEQRYALATLYFSTSGGRSCANAPWLNSTWTMTDSNWLSEKHECEWDGIQCLKPATDRRGLWKQRFPLVDTPSQGTVTSIKLSNTGLIGNLPTELQLLRSLKELDVSHNSLKQLPDIFNNMLQIEVLNFTHNRLAGSIPPTIACLSRIIYLDFSHNNKLVGSIPEVLCDFESLETIIVPESIIEHCSCCYLECGKLNNNTYDVKPQN